MILCLALFLVAPACAQQAGQAARIDQSFREAGDIASQRNFAAAKKVLEKALADARAAGVGRTAQMARLLQWLSSYYNVDFSNSRNDALVAISQAAEAIAIRRELFGPNDLVMAGALRDKAVIEGWSLGNFEASINSFKQAIAIFKFYGDAQRSEVFAALISLSAAQSNRGDVADGQQSSREALLIAQQMGESKDPFRLRTIAHLHRNLGEIDQSVAVSLRALEEVRTAASPDQRLAVELLGDIGYAYARLGLDAKVADYWRQSLRLREQHFSAEPLDVDRVRLADILVSNLHQYDEALTLYEKARLARIASQGPKALPVADVLQAEGFVQLRLQNYAAAEGKYLEALDIRNAQTQSSVALDRALLMSHTSLGQLYQRQPSQLSKAATHFAVADGLVQGLARDVRELTAWTDSRMQFFDATGKQDQALLERFKFYAAQPDFSVAATNLAHSFSHWKENGLPAPRTFIARLFYKQGIQMLELKRKQIKDRLSPILREYDENLKSTYSALADMLITSGRIVEAERVLMLLRNASTTGSQREQVNDLSFTDDEEVLRKQMLALVTYYRGEVERLQRNLPQGESLRGNALRVVQERYAEIDQQLLGRLLPIVNRWREDEYQLYAAPFKVPGPSGAAARPEVTTPIPTPEQIDVVPQSADIRKALDLLAETRLSKSWGEPLNANELAAARFLMGAYDQRWQNIARYWANNQILPILRNGMTAEEKRLVEKLSIRVVVKDQLSAHADIARGEITVTTGLIRAMYDYVSALNWIREYEDLSKHMVTWPVVSMERTRDRGLRTDTSLFFEFLDYAKAAKRPDQSKYISVANDVSEVHQSFAFVVGHEICHFILGHRPFGEVKADVARANEAQADQCAKDRLKAAGYDTDYAAIGLQVLMINGFTAQGRFVFHESHPHTLCRVAPSIDEFLSQTLNISSTAGAALAKSLGFKDTATLIDGYKDLLVFFSAAGKESCENREPVNEPSARTKQLFQSIEKSLGAR